MPWVPGAKGARCPGLPGALRLAPWHPAPWHPAPQHL